MKPQTIQEALVIMMSKGTTEETKWEMLGHILEEFMLAQGVDLDLRSEE